MRLAAAPAIRGDAAVEAEHERRQAVGEPYRDDAERAAALECDPHQRDVVQRVAELAHGHGEIQRPEVGRRRSASDELRPDEPPAGVVSSSSRGTLKTGSDTAGIVRRRLRRSSIVDTNGDSQAACAAREDLPARVRLRRRPTRRATRSSSRARESGRRRSLRRRRSAKAGAKGRSLGHEARDPRSVSRRRGTARSSAACPGGSSRAHRHRPPRGRPLVDLIGASTR